MIKSLIWLTALACAFGLVLADPSPDESDNHFAEETENRLDNEHSNLFEAYPSNESADHLTEEQIKDRLKSSRLEPAQTHKLLTSFNSNLYFQVFEDLDSDDLITIAFIYSDECLDEMTIDADERTCKELDEAGDGSVIFDNLSRYCHDARKKVDEYCAGQKKSAAHTVW